MSRKDASQLIRSIEADGGVVTMTKSGHWRVYNPETRRSIRIAATPGDHRFALNVRTRLRRIGLLLRTAR